MKKMDTSSNNLAEKYFNIAEVMLVVLNADQTVSTINRKGCEVLEYKKNEIIGKNWFDNFLPEESRKETKEVFDKLITGKVKPVEYYKNPVLTKNGEEKTIAWHNTILKDESGKIVCTISSGEDVTERRQLEKEFEKRVEDLEKFYTMAVDREVRMKELKKELKALKVRLSKYEEV